jgi:hypothetical protein
MKKWWLRFCAVALAIAAGFAAVTPAHAIQSVSVKLTSGATRTCSITAITPSVNRTTKVITTSATVKCNITGMVSFTLEVVEMDGTIEDAVIQVPEFRKDVSITKANTNTTFAYTTSYKCTSTESDNEELATKAKIGLGTVWSTIDRVAQASNTSPC